ncbi:kelch-like protein 20 [Acyrthosiphon pisum]|uniref:BTB domain-containing protein n=1 Tax=Acyrthosiphon pisum TaxID=7029 RepID=A0A8R2JRS7_ACYPI|nr:kelch-like protein 20 [Acyrthosiphon pisum]
MSVEDMDTIQHSSSQNNTIEISEQNYFKNSLHPIPILEILQSQRKTGTFCDIKLRTSDKLFITFGHKNTLMAAGPYFREILNTLDEDVTINIADHDILEILVDYIYTGELTLKKVNVEDLLSAAIILKLDFVCAACAGVLHKHLNVSNCLGIRSVAKFNNFTDLLSISEEFIIKQFS